MLFRVNVQIEFVLHKFYEQLNKFNFEPCKIGYKYKDNLYFSMWYLHGGKLCKESEEIQKNENLKGLIEKYRYKNVTNDIDLMEFEWQECINVYVSHRDESLTTRTMVGKRRKSNIIQTNDSTQKKIDFYIIKKEKSTNLN
jgi:hypothetical protein